MAHKDKVPPTLAQLPPELRRAVELGAPPRMETVEKTTLTRCGFAFAEGVNEQGGRFPVIVWIVPVGPGTQREIHIPFSPDALDAYVAQVTALRDTLKAPVDTAETGAALGAEIGE